MGVDVYLWTAGELRLVASGFDGSEGITVEGVPDGRLRALRDRIYCLARGEGVDPVGLRVVVAPRLVGSTRDIEMAAIIAALLGESDTVQAQGAHI